MFPLLARRVSKGPITTRRVSSEVALFFVEIMRQYDIPGAWRDLANVTQLFEPYRSFCPFLDLIQLLMLQVQHRGNRDIHPRVYYVQINETVLRKSQRTARETGLSGV